MRRYAVVFIHGLAKKPSPAKLEEIWRWGTEPPRIPTQTLSRTRTPASTSTSRACRASSTTTPTSSTAGLRDGVRVVLRGESERGERHRSAGRKRSRRSRASITPPQPETPREQRFLEEFERKLREQPTPPTPPAGASASAGPKAGRSSRSRLGCRVRSRRPSSRRPRWRPITSCSTRSTSRADGQRFKVRQRAAPAPPRGAARGGRAGREGRPRHAQHGHHGGLRRAAQLRRTVRRWIRCSRSGRRSACRRCRTNSSPTDQKTRSTSLPRSSRRWINVYDPLDAVCGADPRLSNDYAAVDGKRSRT